MSSPGATSFIHGLQFSEIQPEESPSGQSVEEVGKPRPLLAETANVRMVSVHQENAQL